MLNQEDTEGSGGGIPLAHESPRSLVWSRYQRLLEEQKSRADGEFDDGSELKALDPCKFI